MHEASALFAALPTLGAEILFWISVFGGVALFHTCLAATLAAASQTASKQSSSFTKSTVS